MPPDPSLAPDTRLEAIGAVDAFREDGKPEKLLRGLRQSVDGVSLTQFGTPESMWHLTVKDFPAIVTMDAHGNSLHKDVEQESAKELAALV